MMAPLGWVVAGGLGLVWWWMARRAAQQWRQLLELLEALSAGRSPESFVFRHGGRFAQLTHPLERLAREQERLRAESSREAFSLRTILASMEEAVMVVDAQHVLQLVNPSFARLFELKHDPLGHTVLETLREAAFEELLLAALRTGEAQTGEVECATVKPARHFTAHAVPMREQTGGLVVVMIVREITRLRQLEEVRREFVANVSHELRTPLSIFHGYVENLLDEPKMPRESQAEIYAVLRKHSLRLNALLEDLLTLARLEARQEQLDPALLDVGTLLQGVAADWAGKLREKKLTFSIEAAEHLPLVNADARRLEQVFQNLLENAVKYTEPQGCITLRAAVSNGELEVRVEDTGQGISPADLPHIFERFYRADKARSREQGGTGLGLSIVKHIVQLHGGSVAAESRYGTGTAIILRLPLVAAES
jgi:two-component system phosphate regulon sensor histidine kinase PhoR